MEDKTAVFPIDRMTGLCAAVMFYYQTAFPVGQGLSGKIIRRQSFSLITESLTDDNMNAHRSERTLCRRFPFRTYLNGFQCLTHDFLFLLRPLSNHGFFIHAVD